MEKNATIMNAVWLEASTDFQQRIPDPSIHGIAQTSKALFEPFNRPYLNQFMDILINRIAYTYVHNKTFENPLAIFKRTPIEYGATVSEVALKFIKAHSFRDDWGDRIDDIENLLKVHRPDGSTAYHTVNREDTYPISINTLELRAAFNGEYGLNNLISAIMQVPYNSDNYDEYRIFVELLSFYEYNHGFFKHQLSAAPTDEATGKEFLQAVRAYAGKLRFPSSYYNALSVRDIPVWVNPDEADELVLILTPETQAVLDVQTLASVFNVDLAEIKYRTILVDKIPIDGAVAILTTADFFVCADYAYETTSFFNAQTMTENYYLHHIGMYSVSPFVPAILFTTEAGTNIATVTQTITGIPGILITPKGGYANMDDGGFVGAVKVGGILPFDVELMGTLTADSGDAADLVGLGVKPDAVTWTVIGIDSDNMPVALGAYAWFDAYNQLHVSDQLPANIVGLGVTGTSAYVNPDGTTENMLMSGMIEVVAPEGEVRTDLYLSVLEFDDVNDWAPNFNPFITDYSCVAPAASATLYLEAFNPSTTLAVVVNGTNVVPSGGAASCTFSTGMNEVIVYVSGNEAYKEYRIHVNCTAE